MKYSTIAARSLLGLIFVVFGANYFIGFLEMPKMEGPPAAFMGALVTSGYLTVVKVLEILGGALALSGRYTPVGLLILGPIIVNIVLFDVFLAKAFNPLGFVVTALSLFLLYAYRKNFLPILCASKCSES
jgi:putative oxidoreductase